jgi:hypothetical protein
MLDLDRGIRRDNAWSTRPPRVASLSDAQTQIPPSHSNPALCHLGAVHPSMEADMPQGDKSKYTAKQDRKADHIEKSYESRGVPEKEAERRAWATVNKDDGGGKK